MASVDVIVLLAILFVLQPLTATSNLLSPLLSPVFENVCDKVNCGKGKCKSSQNSTFFYECECDAGWTRTTVNDTLKFLPCIVPNCTLNHACTEAPPPLQQKVTKNNESILNPCHWIDCGGGSCKSKSLFTYSCQCAVDYYNLLNISTLPCFKECSIGMNCRDLGISMSSSPQPAPVLSDNSENQAASNLLVNAHWLILLGISLSLVLR